MIMLSIIYFFRFKQMIFLISLILDTILVVMCSRCFFYVSLGSSLMPRKVGNGFILVGTLLTLTFILYVRS